MQSDCHASHMDPSRHASKMERKSREQSLAYIGTYPREIEVRIVVATNAIIGNLKLFSCLQIQIGHILWIRDDTLNKGRHTHGYAC